MVKPARPSPLLREPVTDGYGCTSIDQLLALKRRTTARQDPPANICTRTYQ